MAGAESAQPPARADQPLKLRDGRGPVPAPGAERDVAGPVRHPRRAGDTGPAATRDRGALLGRVADSFDVVSVGVTHEGTVIAGVILRPDAGFVQHLSADAGRRLEERPHGGPVRRRERDMGLAKSFAAGLPGDPAVWLARGAESDDPA